MLARTYIPTKPNDIIEEFWEIMAENDEPVMSHTFVSAGWPELVFFIGEMSQLSNIPVKYGMVKGIFTFHHHLDFNEKYHLFGIRLKPYGIKQLFGINSHMLTNSFFDIEENQFTMQMHEILNSPGKGSESVIKAIYQHLESRPKTGISLETKRFIKHQKKLIKLKLSNPRNPPKIFKSLEKSFLKEVGMTPVKYRELLHTNHRIREGLLREKDALQCTSVYFFNDKSYQVKEYKMSKKLSVTR